MVIQRSANRFLKSFGSAYAVRSSRGTLHGRFNSVGAARQLAKRLSLSRRGMRFTIWSGRGFSVSVGISFRNGRRSR